METNKVLPNQQMKVSGDQSWGARGLGLDEDDHNIILNQLTDEHMNACSTLLKRANPSQSGLHHTITLAQMPHRCASPADFVQLAHINQAHWVCLSNINCTPLMFLTVHLIVHQVLLKQAASLAQCQNKQLEVRFSDVQVQEGSDDCGVFAIAFATALCDQVDPHSLSLDQKKIT